MTVPERKLRVCILGSTGSIGTNTLDVIARHPQRFEVFALTGASRVDELFEQCLRWKPRFAALPDAARSRVLRERLAAFDVPTEVLAGPQGGHGQRVPGLEGQLVTVVVDAHARIRIPSGSRIGCSCSRAGRRRPMISPIRPPVTMKLAITSV